MIASVDEQLILQVLRRVKVLARRLLAVAAALHDSKRTGLFRNRQFRHVPHEAGALLSGGPPSFGCGVTSKARERPDAVR